MDITLAAEQWDANAVEVAEVTMEYSGLAGGTTIALESIDLYVRRGEFLSIIGPSGCGKSTLLQLIGGLRKPTGGTIVTAGRQVKGPMPDRVAFVFQDYRLLPWRSVLSNVAFGLEIRGLPKKEREAIARTHIDTVGLSDVVHAYPKELSGGMLQRVAVARALAMDPEILLMDEPFGALDEQTRLVLGQEMSRILTETGKTIVFVTHSLSEALALSDTVAVMTASPGTFKEFMKVSAPRPRDDEFLLSDEFAKLRAQLFGLLRSEIHKSVELS